jgi:hypothetical protein
MHEDAIHDTQEKLTSISELLERIGALGEDIRRLNWRIFAINIKMVVICVAALAWYWYQGFLRLFVVSTVFLLCTVLGWLAPNRWYSGSVATIALIAATVAF